MSAYHKQGQQSNENRDQELGSKQRVELDLQEAVKQRFNSFCMSVGIQTLMSMMEQDVEAAAGQKGKHNPDRTAYRHGKQKTTIPAGSQRLEIERPRIRSLETDRELPIPSYDAFANDEELLEAALNRMLHGMSSRDYRHGIEPYDDRMTSSGTSKSSVSERFVKASSKKVKDVLNRRFDDETIPVVLIDGIQLGDYTAVVAMGITAEGKKVIMGVRIGSTENAEVCQDLLTDLIDRGLRFHRGLLAVIDGAKALRKALKTVFGHNVLIQRCQVHKLRNVLDYLPKHRWEWVKRKMRKAYACDDYADAVRQLRSLATSLAQDHPDASASLREGLEETVTVLHMTIPGLLQRSLRSTNAIESGFSMVAKNIRNVKNWKNGSMVKRWVCSALLDAESRTHRIAGYRSLHLLITELQRLTVTEETQEVDGIETQSNTA